MYQLQIAMLQGLLSRAWNFQRSTAAFHIIQVQQQYKMRNVIQCMKNNI